MLHEKQIRAIFFLFFFFSIFLLKFKMGHKAAETTRNNNNTFDPGTANKCTVQWWFKKFRKGDKSLEDGEHRGQPLEADKHATTVTD